MGSGMKNNDSLVDILVGSENLKINPSSWSATNSIYLICFLLSLDIPLSQSWQNSRSLLQEQPPAPLHELTWQQVLSRRGDNHLPLVFPINPLILHDSAAWLLYLFMLLLAKQGKSGAENPQTSLFTELWAACHRQRDTECLQSVRHIQEGLWPSPSEGDSRSSVPFSVGRSSWKGLSPTKFPLTGDVPATQDGPGAAFCPAGFRNGVRSL